jgi:hypothetical protein
MNKEQKQAVRCAYLDLVGAAEAVDSGDPHAHDWKAVATTISEMVSAFPTELKDLLD